jgi:hypothetical protein
MSHSNHPRSLSTPCPLPTRTPHRHELHRAVDGDWPAEPWTPAERRHALAMGLSVVAALPVTSLVLERWADASPALTAALALLPLAALLLVAARLRTTGGEP